MSRLYVTHGTDLTRTGSQGRRYATAQVRWGSKGDSKLAVNVTVTWSKDQPKPTILIEYGSEWIDEVIEETVLKETK